MGDSLKWLDENPNGLDALHAEQEETRAKNSERLRKALNKLGLRKADREEINLEGEALRDKVELPLSLFIRLVNRIK